LSLNYLRGGVAPVKSLCRGSQSGLAEAGRSQATCKLPLVQRVNEAAQRNAAVNKGLGNCTCTAMAQNPSSPSYPEVKNLQRETSCVPSLVLEGGRRGLITEECPGVSISLPRPASDRLARSGGIETVTQCQSTGVAGKGQGSSPRADWLHGAFTRSATSAGLIARGPARPRKPDPMRHRAPWPPPALLHPADRSVLFRSSRGCRGLPKPLAGGARVKPKPFGREDHPLVNAATLLLAQEIAKPHATSMTGRWSAPSG
jgi:hypothetical protein